jgi:hypothetical protein
LVSFDCAEGLGLQFFLLPFFQLQPKDYSFGDGTEMSSNAASEIWLKEVAIPLEESIDNPVSHPLPIPEGLHPWDYESESEPNEQILSSVFHIAGPLRSFVIWRLLANNRILELRRVFLTSASTEDAPDLQKPDLSRASRPVQFGLHVPALSSPQVFQDSENFNLHIMLVTRAGTFYRLIFQLPNYFADLSEPGASLPLDCVQMYQIRSLDSARVSTPSTPSGLTAPAGLRITSKSPKIVHFSDLDTIFVGCFNGTIIQVNCPRTDRGSKYRDLMPTTTKDD